jgi:hypothetical protein
MHEHAVGHLLSDPRHDRVRLLWQVGEHMARVDLGLAELALHVPSCLKVGEPVAHPRANSLHAALFRR